MGCVAEQLVLQVESLTLGVYGSHEVDIYKVGYLYLCYMYFLELELLEVVVMLEAYVILVASVMLEGAVQEDCMLELQCHSYKAFD